MRLSKTGRTGTGALAAAILALAAPAALALEESEGATPERLTAEQDHRRLMDLLGIDELRPGANGLDPEAPNAANYDEAKANPFPRLPDPLVFNDGTPVISPEAWRAKRRAELIEHFDSEIYGRTPADAPAIRWTVSERLETEEEGIAVIRKQLAGRADNGAHSAIDVEIEASLTTPADAAAPVPVIVHFGWRPPPGFPPFPAEPGPGWKQQILERGWGYAELYPVSVQADNGAGLAEGIIGLANMGAPRSVDDWGALRAWAWGASRLVDYLETDDEADASRIVIEGLSRYGKAALVAMAYDERFAIGFVGSSGAGGAKLHRRNFGELVENLAGSGQYHWMAGNYLKYAGPLSWNDLPVDSHQLIALAAPRPLFISVGSFDADKWTDPKGMFLAAAAASPVYEFLGAKGLGATDFPPPETAFVDGEIAFRQHTGGHTNGPNWPHFLDFAARYFGEGEQP